MKLRVGDQVLVTSGKDKGKTGKVTRVVPKDNTVVVEGMNQYVKHIKPQGERAGEKVRRERPLSTAKVAILNEKGQPDRVGYRVAADGKKERIFKKTGTVIAAVKAEKVVKAAKAESKPEKAAKAENKTTKKAKTK